MLRFDKKKNKMFNKVQTSCFVYKYCVILLLEKECSKIKRKKTALQEKPLFSGSLFPHGLSSDRGVLGKDEVTGSTPVISSKVLKTLRFQGFLFFIKKSNRIPILKHSF